MTNKERALLIEGYMIGMQNASRFAADGISVADVKKEAARWVDEVIADNGATVGQYICHFLTGEED